MKQQPAQLTVSTGDLAKMLGITPRRVQQLVQAGVLPQPVQGRHDLSTAIPGYLAHLRQSMRPASLADEQTRLARLKGDILEQKKRERDGELVEVSACAEQWASVAMAIRASLLNLPAKLSPQLIGQRSIPDVSGILKTAIREALEELSRLSAEDVERLAKRRKQKAS